MSAYSFYTKKTDPFNFAYLNAAKNAQVTPPPTTPPTTTVTKNVTVSSAPDPTKRVTPPPVTTPQPTDALKAVNQPRQAYYDQRAKDTETRTREQQAIDASLAEKQKANLQSRYDQYAGQLDKSIAGQEQATAEQKQLLEDQTGEELRNQAQTAREGRGRLQNMFGALGAIDSSAFQNFAARSEDRLATGQAKSQQQLKFDKNASDRDLATFKSGVEEKKMTELQKFYDAADMIDANLQKGTLEYNRAIQDAYDKATDAMYAMDAEVAKMDAEYQNKAKIAGLEDQSKNASAMQTRQQLADTIQKLAGMDTGAITGVRNPFKFMTGEAQLTKNTYNQLKGLLSLDNISKLKGTGAISDAEQLLLSQASSALGTNLSNEGFKQVLNELASTFGGGNQDQDEYDALLTQWGY